MKIQKFTQFVNEDQSSMNEPTQPARRQFGTIDKLKSILMGKTVQMTGSSTNLKPILKIENVAAQSSTGGNVNEPGFMRDQIYLNCTIINQYGNEIGGLGDSGHVNNVDVFYNCINNPKKIFKIDTELIGGVNHEIGGETYVNPNLSNAIETNYISSVTPQIKTDY